MDYNEALAYIHGTQRFGSKLGLERMKQLMDLLGNPQEQLKVIHIAGTNGKGSTSAMIHSILKEEGYRVGLFISPYLEEFTERIQVDGKHIDPKSLGEITQRVKEAIDRMIAKGFDHPTEFEMVTAIAFVYFMEEKVDFVVLEVGLGGRFDATNILSNSEVSIITSIGWDHMVQLGNTLEKIAAEKAGIIKEGGRVVVYPQKSAILEVIGEYAKKKGAKVYGVKSQDIQVVETSLQGQILSYGDGFLSLPRLEIPLLGKHQIYNAATALKAMEVLQQRGYDISTNAILEGMKKVKWPGRFELVNHFPTIVLDGAHNRQGAEAFAKGVQTYFQGQKIILIIGILKDKEVDRIIQTLLPLGKEIITITPNNPRAMEAKVLAEKIQDLDPKVTCRPMDSVKEAVTWAKSRKSSDIIAFTGSLYMIGEVRKIMSPFSKKDI